jgi:hypothetical protein
MSKYTRYIFIASQIMLGISVMINSFNTVVWLLAHDWMRAAAASGFLVLIVFSGWYIPHLYALAILNIETAQTHQAVAAELLKRVESSQVALDAFITSLDTTTPTKH